jgi:hypothetical protein
VIGSPSSAGASIPVDNDGGSGRYTGYAIANPSDDNLNIRIYVLDEKGTVVTTLDPGNLNPLGPRQQVSRFLHQDAPSTLTFRGSMVLTERTGKKFLVVALVQNQGLLAAIPVISEKPPVVP